MSQVKKGYKMTPGGSLKPFRVPTNNTLQSDSLPSMKSTRTFKDTRELKPSKNSSKLASSGKEKPAPRSQLTEYSRKHLAQFKQSLEAVENRLEAERNPPSNQTNLAFFGRMFSQLFQKTPDHLYSLKPNLKIPISFTKDEFVYLRVDYTGQTFPMKLRYFCPNGCLLTYLSFSCDKPGPEQKDLAMRSSCLLVQGLPHQKGPREPVHRAKEGEPPESPSKARKNPEGFSSVKNFVYLGVRPLKSISTSICVTFRPKRTFIPVPKMMGETLSKKALKNLNKDLLNALQSESDSSEDSKEILKTSAKQKTDHQLSGNFQQSITNLSNLSNRVKINYPNYLKKRITSRFTQENNESKNASQNSQSDFQSSFRKNVKTHTFAATSTSNFLPAHINSAESNSIYNHFSEYKAASNRLFNIILDKRTVHANIKKKMLQEEKQQKIISKKSERQTKIAVNNLIVEHLLSYFTSNSMKPTWLTLIFLVKIFQSGIRNKVLVD